MIDRMIQVPVSLIERAWWVAKQGTYDASLAADLRALLSQQPTADQQPAVDRIQADLLAVAEPMEPGGLRTALLDIAEGDYSQPTQTAEPTPCRTCGYPRAGWHWDDCTARPQPAPTAEPCERCGGTGYQGDGPFTLGVPCPNCSPAEPPRIENMAPGTTFTANGTRWRVFGNGGSTLIAETLDGGHAWELSDFDPSMIRDVTPPKEV